MSYIGTANRLTTHDRAEQWDLALSPTEETRAAAEFGGQIGRLLTNNHVTGLWAEIGDAARQRARLGIAPPNTALARSSRPEFWAPRQSARLAAQAWTPRRCSTRKPMLPPPMR